MDQKLEEIVLVGDSIPERFHPIGRPLIIGSEDEKNHIRDINNSGKGLGATHYIKSAQNHGQYSRIFAVQFYQEIKETSTSI